MLISSCVSPEAPLERGAVSLNAVVADLLAAKLQETKVAKK